MFRLFYHRTDSDYHTRKLLPGIFDQFPEYFLREIAAVSEFKCTDATVITSLENVLRRLRIAMIEHRNHTGFLHGLDDLDFAVCCHFVYVVPDALSLYPAVRVSACKTEDLLLADEIEISVDSVLEG